MLRVHDDVRVSVVVDYVSVSINLQNRLEFSVDDDVDRLLERLIEMHLHSQVAFMYQIEMGTVTTIRCDIKNKQIM